VEELPVKWETKAYQDSLPCSYVEQFRLSLALKEELPIYLKSRALNLSNQTLKKKQLHTF
jgi:hypothetical protein